MCRTTGGWGQFLTQLAAGPGVSGSLCWPASGRVLGTTGPRAGSGQLVSGEVCRLQDCGFLATAVCPLVGGAGREARVGSLVGGAGALGILVLVPDHCWVELGPRVSGWRVLVVLVLVPVYWCVEPGPGSSGGQGCVQRQLWIKGS